MDDERSGRGGAVIPAAPTIVVPFRAGKTRLDADGRTELALAMLEDVLAACRPVGPTIVADAESGQGSAVRQALEALEGIVAIVNADLPCLTPDDVRALLDSLPEDGMAIAPAADGTTNALALADPSLFASLYGPGSAEEFRSHASQLGVPSVVVSCANLADDVDTLADLERVAERVGPHTRAVAAAPSAR
ncbi:MAG TPA: NTP transferase domain-containing protein [Gaiellaceae bacterium]|nr:NTP transferase domain-containing protein [Gaiellaceae bacterium]